MSQTVIQHHQYNNQQYRFFPSISLDEIRSFVRIDGAVSDARLKQVTLEEIIDVNRLLNKLVSSASSLAELAKKKLMENQIQKFCIFQLFQTEWLQKLMSNIEVMTQVLRAIKCKRINTYD